MIEGWTILCDKKIKYLSRVKVKNFRNYLKMEFGNRDHFNLINIRFSSDQHLCDHLKV